MGEQSSKDLLYIVVTYINHKAKVFSVLIFALNSMIFGGAVLLILQTWKSDFCVKY